MDVLHQPYTAVMEMPSGRRKRFVEETSHLMKIRNNKK